MIRDLSLSLRAFFTQEAAGLTELSAAHIGFDRPADGFNPAQATVSLYLYDIRENLDLRNQAPDVSIVSGQVMRNSPPRRIACTYLITAWPGNVTGDELALGEHRLLAQVLLVLMRNPTLPPQYLTGLLTGQAPPLPLVTTQPDGTANPSEFWTAINNRLRPAISLSVTFSIPTAAAAEVLPLVVSSETIFRREDGSTTSAYRIGGQITDAANAPVSGSTVSIPSLGLASVTGADGRFILGAIPAATYTLHVLHGTTSKDVTISVPAAAPNAYDVKLG